MRLLHTMLRVGDLQRSIDCYTKTLEIRLLSTSENPEYKYTLALVGYTDESKGAVIQLTYNWDLENYDFGSGGGHIALEVDNAAPTYKRIRQAGGKLTRETVPTKSGITVIAFIEDSDDYKIELLKTNTPVKAAAIKQRTRGQYSAPRGHHSPCNPR